MISSQESLTNICKDSTILSLEFLENIFGKSTIHIYIREIFEKNSSSGNLKNTWKKSLNILEIPKKFLKDIFKNIHDFWQGSL